MKFKSYNFFNKQKNVKSYSLMYEKKMDIKKIYPANNKRLEIIIKLLKKYKPKKIIDAGCGTAQPLISIKKLGFDIRGYDKAPNMINEAQIHLKNNHLDKDLIFKDDFEKPKFIKNNSVDCILGLGSFYYSKNFKKTMKLQMKQLKKNGRIIFSLRNELFNIATFNDYTVNFFSKLYNIENKNPKVKKIFLNLFKNFFLQKKNKIKNIDTAKVQSIVHNPLTIAKELKEINIKINGIYYYHFHHLPPFFENMYKKEFRNKSLKIEIPTDWRGTFKASAFVVDGQKIK